MENRKKRLGDRWDAYRVRGLDSLHIMQPYIFKSRTANEAVQGEVFDLTAVDTYLAAKNAEHPEFKYTWFHFIVAAIAKTILLRPKMNYFISGRHYYEHDKIEIAFVVKREFADDAAEALVKFVLDREGGSPVEQVHSFVQKVVTKVRGTSDAHGIDGVMNFLKYLPRPVFRVFIGVLNSLEYFGIYPKALAVDDPCYSSVFVSNLGSIRLSADYHHLYDWGTVSFFAAIGERKMRPYYHEDGSYDLRNSVKIGITIDERIADGYYFAKSIHLVRHFFEHPELLDLPAATPVDMSKL